MGWVAQVAALDHPDAFSALTLAGTRVGNGEALAREIPGARLLVLEEEAAAIPDAAAGEVAAAMLAL